MNILVIPDKRFPLRHALLESVFLRALPQRGHRVFWLLESLEEERQGGWKDMGGSEAYVTRFLPGEDRKSQFLNMFYWRPRGRATIFSLLRSRRIDVVLVRNEVQAAIAASIACWLRGIPFAYYLAFPNEEAAIASSRRGWSRTRYAIRVYMRLMLFLRNLVTRKADFVFTMSDYWREELIKSLGIPPERMRALPFGFDASICPDPSAGERIRSELGLNGHPLILYLGTIGPPRDVTILADIMANVAKEVPDARLLILPNPGGQRFVPRLEKEFEKKGVRQCVVFVPPVPHKMVPSYIAAADLGLSPIETIPIYNVSSPAKFVEMMGMGCPVVASDVPEQRRLLEKSGGGVCVPYEASAFSREIVRLLRNPDFAHDMGRKGRKFVEEHRNFELLADSVEEVFRSLVARGRP